MASRITARALTLSCRRPTLSTLYVRTPARTRRPVPHGPSHAHLRCWRAPGPTQIAPRTMVGHDSDGRLFLVVVQGSERNNRGLKIYGLADLAKYLGLVNAVNLDGTAIPYASVNVGHWRGFLMPASGPRAWWLQVAGAPPLYTVAASSTRSRTYAQMAARPTASAPSPPSCACGEVS